VTAAWCQSEDPPVSLGDVARSAVRQPGKKKEQPATPNPTPAPAPSHTIIDNDNLTQVVEEAESHHLANTSMTYSFEGAAKMFQISSPDVTCSLSFNGHMSSLLIRPATPIDVPEEEVRKLEGPAAINEDGLQVSVFNGTRWRIEEITVGITVVRYAYSESRTRWQGIAVWRDW
jgi:Fe-S cluster assembly iron-binding protein IscA